MLEANPASPSTNEATKSTKLEGKWGERPWRWWYVWNYLLCTSRSQTKGNPPCKSEMPWTCRTEMDCSLQVTHLFGAFHVFACRANARARNMVACIQKLRRYGFPSGTFVHSPSTWEEGRGCQYVLSRWPACHAKMPAPWFASADHEAPRSWKESYWSKTQERVFYFWHRYLFENLHWAWGRIYVDHWLR